jgi:hypothetical protein
MDRLCNERCDVTAVALAKDAVLHQLSSARGSIERSRARQVALDFLREYGRVPEAAEAAREVRQALRAAGLGHG